MSKTSIITSLAILAVVVAGGAYFIFTNQNENTASLQQNQQEQTPANTSYEIQGMKVEILKEGSGDPIGTGDKATVDYVGTLQNGAKFDSSIDRGEPFSFTLGENKVIKGWELGVLGMKVGEKRKLTVPPELAYGNQAVGGVIPANSTLIFEVDLLDITPPGK